MSDIIYIHKICQEFCGGGEGKGGSTPDRLKKSGVLAVKGERKEDVKGILKNMVRSKKVSIVMSVETKLYA
jgi:hypothetical protein